MYKSHVTIDGYDHISNVVDTTNRKLQEFRNGEINPIKTSSLKEQDKIGGILPGEQITIAGRTGMGKSAFILRWMEDFVNYDLNPDTANNTIILFDSWEMLPWRHMLRLYSNATELNVKTILDYKREMQEEAFQRILNLKHRFYNLPVYFRHISEGVEKWVENKKRIRDKNPEAIIINIVDHTRLVMQTNERSEQELIHNFMVKGMKLKLEEDMVNIFLSQMNRNIESNASNRDSIGKNLPIASDIFGADSVYQCSDLVVALHRPGMYGLKEWDGIPTGITDDANSQDHLFIEVVLKQRDGWTGNLIRRHNLAINKIEDYDRTS